ncbi:MAG: hypothetical protein Q9196_001927 [Gyalolechia fulgens]
MQLCSHVIRATVEELLNGIEYASNITGRDWDAAAKLQSEKNSNADVRMLFLHFLLPMIVVAMAMNLWLACVRPWEYHRHDARNAGRCECYEDWLLLDGETESESLLPATRYNGVKESPLSPAEVDRLASLIRADDGMPRSSGRKRKAAGEDSPASDVSTDGGSVSPRTRKLKIQTVFGVDQRWVSDVSDYGSCAQEENVLGHDSYWGEYPFAFRASCPAGKVKPRSLEVDAGMSP